MNRPSPSEHHRSSPNCVAAESDRRSRKLTRRRFVVFLVLIWLGILASAEVVLRLVGFAPTPVAQVPGHYDPFQSDTDLIWSLKPAWNGFELNGATVSINSLGLRGPAVSPTPAASVKRVLFLGDSVVFGHGLGDGSSIPSQLEQQLNQPSAEHKTEVLNAGVPGYSTFQSELYYRLHGQHLKPDLVLLGFCFNDVTERYTSVATYGGRRIFMKNVDTSAGMSWPQRLWRKLAVRQALVSMRRDAARRGENYRVERLWTDSTAQHIKEAWQLVFDEIDRLAQAVDESGAEFVVVIFPYSVQLLGNGPGDGPQGVLRHHLEAHGIPILDLLDRLKQTGEPPEVYFVDDNHFTTTGSAIVASQIAELINERALLSD